jgi:hypothetical protein
MQRPNRFSQYTKAIEKSIVNRTEKSWSWTASKHGSYPTNAAEIIGS